MLQNRREFLKLFGLATAAASSPVEIFLDILVSCLVNRASAKASSTKDTCKYILIQQAGAPPRWMFDLFLNPYGNNPMSKVMDNGSVASELTLSRDSERYVGTRYATHKVKGINAPLIWTHDVANRMGSRVPLSDLMDNMIVLQGVDALNPGHIPAQRLMNRPLTRYSIDGILADQAHMPFSGIGLGSSHLDFKSAKGKRAKQYKAEANIVDLLSEAFEAGIGDIHQKYSKEIDQAVAKLNRGIASVKLGGRSVNFDQKSAKNLMLGEIKKIKRVYPSLFNKYNRIITETVRISQNLKGYTDRSIGKMEGRAEDVRYLLGKNITVNDMDMRRTLIGANIPELAKQFALAEYIITNNLTATTSLNVNSLEVKINGKEFVIANDQHKTGVIASVLYSTLYYRIMSACMLGLIDGLKSTPYKGSNMFNHTVIRSGGEFGRLPKKDSSGSDHAPWSSNTMLLSGMIKKPIVAGQIRKDGASVEGGFRGIYGGSYGAGGSLKHGETATTGHVVSSIATMLDVPAPSANHPTLLVKDQDGSVSLNEGYISKTEVI